MARHGVKISATRMQRATENGDEVQAWGSSNRALREQGAMMSPTGALSPPSALQSSWKLALNLVCEMLARPRRPPLAVRLRYLPGCGLPSASAPSASHQRLLSGPQSYDPLPAWLASSGREGGFLPSSN